MRDRSSLYVGLLMVLFGFLFLCVALGGAFTGGHGGWARLWPLAVVYLGGAFWLPFVVWWPRRAQFAGIAVPATIITGNGLLLLYQSLTGDWRSWAYAWALEPVFVAAGLFVLYLLTDRPKGLLFAVAIVGGIGIMMYLVFGSAFGGPLRWLAPIALMFVGLLLMLRGVRGRADAPGE